MPDVLIIIFYGWQIHFPDLFQYLKLLFLILTIFRFILQ